MNNVVDFISIRIASDPAFFWFICLIPLILVTLNKMLSPLSASAHKCTEEMIEKNNEFDKWSSATGVVLAHEKVEGVTTGSEPVEYFFYRIKYKYTVDNQEYISSCYKLGGPPSIPDAILMKYPVGSEVIVHYNPVSHNECCLVKSSAYDCNHDYVISSMFIGIVILFSIGLTYCFIMTFQAKLLMAFLCTMVWLYLFFKHPKMND